MRKEYKGIKVAIEEFRLFDRIASCASVTTVDKFEEEMKNPAPGSWAEAASWIYFSSDCALNSGNIADSLESYLGDIGNSPSSGAPFSS